MYEGIFGVAFCVFGGEDALVIFEGEGLPKIYPGYLDTNQVPEGEIIAFEVFPQEHNFGFESGNVSVLFIDLEQNDPMKGDIDCIPMSQLQDNELIMRIYTKYQELQFKNWSKHSEEVKGFVQPEDTFAAVTKDASGFDGQSPIHYKSSLSERCGDSVQEEKEDGESIVQTNMQNTSSKTTKAYTQQGSGVPGDGYT